MTLYKTIGLMSGTSLDGVDIAYCEFTLENQRWRFALKAAETYPYDERWKHRLSTATGAPAVELLKTDRELGALFGKMTRDFIKKNRVAPDFIASHGHTIFHQPEERITLQIGSGYEIMKATNLKVIADFRTLDVLTGGQGAPLVPAGDRALFPEYDFCLNLGGISNVSYESDGKRLAFDVAPNNLVLNRLAGELGLPYDNNGDAARNGKLHSDLFDRLNEAPYYQIDGPKSMGVELIGKEFWPLLDGFQLPVADKLHTFARHIAYQIDRHIRKRAGSQAKVLATGGGAFNGFLIQTLREYASGRYVVELPPADIINFKEALVFAFLGTLRYRGEINVLSSATGAAKDTCSGLIYDNPAF